MSSKKQKIIDTKQQSTMERLHSVNSKRYHHILKDGSFISYTGTKEGDPQKINNFYEKIIKPITKK